MLHALTPAEAGRICDLPFAAMHLRAELLMYNLRHVQHGAAQLNLVLREETGSAPRW